MKGLIRSFSVMFLKTDIPATELSDKGCHGRPHHCCLVADSSHLGAPAMRNKEDWLFFVLDLGMNAVITYPTQTAQTPPKWVSWLNMQLQHSGTSFIRYPYIGVSYRISLFAVRQCSDVQVWQEKTRTEYFLINSLLIERLNLKIWVLESEIFFWYHPLWKVRAKGMRSNKTRSIHSKAGVT